MHPAEFRRYFVYFHHATALPLILYERSRPVLQLPEGGWSAVLEPYREPLLREAAPVSFILTKQSVFYGRLEIAAEPGTTLVLGPVSSIPIGKHMAGAMFADAGAPLRTADEWSGVLESFPVLDFHRFLYMLCYLHYVVNGAALTPDAIAAFKDMRYAVPIAADYTSQIYTAKEHRQFHNTHHFEQRILHLVETGDPAALKALLDRPLRLTPGIVAADNLRQTKNLFIAAATLTTRAAVRGGMDIQEAYQLSDVYIRHMEKMTSIPSIQNLQYQMLLDFTERVSSAKISARLSGIVRECVSFIHNHTNQPITLKDVAEHAGLSRSHLSRKFAAEMGVGVNAYIHRQKVEEAKRLLAFSRMSLGEISSYLCYSSQSYFQKIFKKMTGVTPHRYRADERRRSAPGSDPSGAEP